MSFATKKDAHTPRKGFSNPFIKFDFYSYALWSITVDFLPIVTWICGGEVLFNVFRKQRKLLTCAVIYFIYLYISVYIPIQYCNYLLYLLYVSMYFSIFLSFYFSIFLSFYLSIYLSFYLSIFLSFYLSFYLSIFLTI